MYFLRAFGLCAAVSLLSAIILFPVGNGALPRAPGQDVGETIDLEGAAPESYMKIITQTEFNPLDLSPGTIYIQSMDVGIICSGIWEISAKDANNKIDETGGKMTKFHQGNENYDNNIQLENPLKISTGVVEDVTIEEEVPILNGCTTFYCDDKTLWESLIFKQTVAWNDTPLKDPPYKYRIDISFIGRMEY